MRKSVLALLAFAFALSGILLAEQPQSVVVSRPELPSFVGYVAGEIVVQFKVPSDQMKAARTKSGYQGLGVASLDVLADQFKVTGMRREFPGAKPEMINGRFMDLSRHYVVQVDPNANLDDVIAAYKNNPFVESAEPIGIHAVYATPNDGFFGDQWHLTQPSDRDVDAPEAWDIETGDPAIIVAIMDTGVRYYHKDLGGSNASSTNPTGADGNMWINWTEKNGTAGIDDDGNGYVDDWVGWDFVTGVTGCWSGEDCSTADNDPRDFNGHGTHCAGNVGAINNNGYASCAVSGGWGSGAQQPTGNGVKVMACRIGYSGSYLGQEVGYVRMDFAASAFYYAANKGAKIASCSWGSSNSGGLDAALTYFLNQGGIIFHAAGNDASETADYMGGRTDIVNVCATDSNDCLADFSTHGAWVDIAAPGTGILSSYHNHADAANDYVATMDGTSMATPIAASVAALIWSKNLTWTATQVLDKLYTSADDVDALPCNSSQIGKMGAGRVNAYNSVYGGCDVAANFSGTPTSGCAPLNVTFTDASTGPVTSWSWTFGDGGTSTAQNPTHQYVNAGTYSVALTVSNGTCNNTMTKTNYITVITVPVANFVGSPTSGYAPLTVNFTDQSTGGPTGWSWNFGDAGTSTLQNPSHIYTTAGTYSVTLTASNACGSNQVVKTNYITVNTPPAQQCDDFADGNITNWLNKTGTWTATGGYMKGNSNTTNAQTTSPFGSFSTATINCDVRMNTGRTQRNARIIFAYVDANNYRYVEGDDLNNRWRIYERVGGTNTSRFSVSQTINTAQWYAVKVTAAADGMATLIVGGTTLGSYKFAAAVNGPVGCGFTKSNSDFDNFCVGASAVMAMETDLPVFAKEQPLPAILEMVKCYPNPFNPSTTISYSLTSPATVNIQVYNVLGQRVKDLFDGYANAGLNAVVWNGTDESNAAVASGVYFFTVTVDDNQPVVKKMMLMK